MTQTTTSLAPSVKLTALLVAAQGITGTGFAQETQPAPAPEPQPSPEKKAASEKKTTPDDSKLETVKTGPASDAATAKKLDEVVVKGHRQDPIAPSHVSSPKYPLPLVDTPQTIQIVTQELMQQQSATSLQDVLRNTPGIMMATGEGGNTASSFAGDSFYMRGFDASGSIFVDGVRNLGAMSRDMFNYEQVEIVKGPAGENGKGVASGYINLVTKTPQLREFGTATASYGFSEVSDIERLRGTIDYNVPIENSPWAGTAVRVNVLLQDGGVAGRDYVENNSIGFAPSVAFGLGTDTRVIATYQYLKQNNVPDYGVPTSIIKDLANPALYLPGVSTTNFYGLVNQDQEVIENHVASLRFEHDFSDRIKFTNHSAFSFIERTARLSIVDRVELTSTPPTTVSVAHRRYERETENFANLSNLQIQFETGPLAHTVSTGVEIGYEDSYIPTFPNTVPERESGVDIAHPDPYRQPPAAVLPGPAAGNSKGNSTTIGLYAYDNIQFAKRWIVDGGFRLDYYDNEYKNTNAAGVTTRNTADDVNVSWKAGLTFKPAENGSIYAAAGTAIRPPGTNLTYSTGATNIDNPTLDPQVSYNYEVGTKWEFFEGRFAPALALFRNEMTNLPYTDPVTSLVSQARDQVVQGVEISAAGRITPEWLVYAGFAYMHTEVTRAAAPSPTDGNHMGLAPEYSANLWTSYRFPFGLTAGVGAQFVGRTDRVRSPAAGTDSNSPYIPSYWLFNAMLAYEISESFTVQFNVNNIFDEDYVVNYNDSGRRAMPGAPRNYTLSATLKF